MEIHYSLRNFSKPFKCFIAAFIVVLSIGFFTGLFFVGKTESNSPRGMIENYNGNEGVNEIKVMKFKKGAREMLTIIHTHILSLSFIFFFLGILVWGTEASVLWKSILSIEPFVSVLTTFGGIYLIWLEYHFMSYVVMISGILMTLSYTIGVCFIIKSLLKPPLKKNSIG
ncbi:MAG: hypothetical protein ACI9TK_001137 [Flavobacteriaceae bacterium]|jgi:hypothetical protein|tara:strand:+ start:1765 stop:2274 length:510 start_codon:yes stop_codon:yes gene_type:complete